MTVLMFSKIKIDMNKLKKVNTNTSWNLSKEVINS